MKKLITVISVCSLLLVGCGSKDEETSKEADKTIVIGASAVPHAEILESVKEDLAKEGYTLEVKVYDDYVQPNIAVDEGEIDANYFQHEPYLEGFNKDNGTDVVSIAKIHFEPIGLYSEDTKEPNPDFSVADVKDGAVIAVPDDPTNEARALQLLADRGVISVKEGVGLEATKADIIDNPKNVEIREVKADGVAATLPDVDYAIINGNYALTNDLADKLIASENTENEAIKDYVNEYANILAVKKGNEDSPKIKALVKALTSEKTKKFIEDTYGDLVIAVF